LPEEYRQTLDPFVALAAMAAVTERIRLGTGICLVVQRDPIITAKEVATLDVISGGRFLFGVGGGWNREEMEHHGTDPTTRFALLRERVLAMQAIWTNDQAEFHGVLMLPPQPATEVIPRLDRYRKLAGTWLGDPATS
jgi:alkanesulfonate monooxygenase SsuD/methylene tetrahydromethanopterin reductase-like flavin-dependent oxidoreductase (luciferase family)